MKLFQCTNCKNTVVFENNKCLNCGFKLGYSSYYNKIVSLDHSASSWQVEELDGKTYEYCENYNHKVCNWLVDVLRGRKFCLACTLNRTIPHLLDDDNLEKWKHIEIAKHRLVYQLLRFRLPVVRKTKDAIDGFCFDFLAQDDLPEDSKDLKTGHANGVITLLISEADPVVREQIKQQMAERYRTLLGHFRHEVGHYFWDLLIRDNPDVLVEFRNIFGDESQSYADALANHYNNGPKVHWQQSYISKYASSHPWEDWAETWSHYLHLTDVLETAYNFGLSSDPKITAKKNLKMNAGFDPYKVKDFKKIMDTGIPLLFALNSMNRSMGEDDPYPFVISKSVENKLEFIHNLLKGI